MRTPVLGNFPRLQFFVTSIILALLFAPSALAQTQSTTGTIQGTVVDANGAVVPGANVEIKNLDTNFSRSLPQTKKGDSSRLRSRLVTILLLSPNKASLQLYFHRPH